MLKRIFIIVVLLALTTSCAYQAIQSAQFSKLNRAPMIIENKKEYQLYLEPNQHIDPIRKASNTQKKEQIKGDEHLVTYSKKEGRLSVVLQTSDTDTLLLSNRRIYFEKVPNFRDLGGIKTTEGKTIHWGKIFRSGHLNKIKKSELKTLEQLNIGTLVDLRTPVEIDKKPDQFPRSTTYFQYNAFEEEQDQLIKTRKAVFKGEISPSESVALQKEFYRYYPTRDTVMIRTIISTLLHQDHAVLFHCSAGKDRTGIIGALILSVLKVDRETIYQEYLLSNNYRQQDIESQLRLLKIGRLIYPSLNQEVVEHFSWINVEYLKAAFEEIESNYGSVENYIHQVLKISEGERQVLIEKFTY